MRYLGIDIGRKRIGVAIGDSETKLAFAFMTLQNNEKLAESLKEIIREESVDKIIVGLPVSLSGVEGPWAETIRKITEDIFSKIDLPMDWQDERLSTVEAEKKLLEVGVSPHEITERIDAAAAAIILQDYLDSLVG